MPLSYRCTARVHSAERFSHTHCTRSPCHPSSTGASCGLSFNSRLSMGENFGDWYFHYSVAHHPLDTPSPSVTAEQALTPESLSIAASCALTPLCGRHRSVVSSLLLSSRVPLYPPSRNNCQSSQTLPSTIFSY